ncbi:MAG: C-GCAxxG-C-C family protein [Defluviitaleaceae bacterium]|nr:C-GCAxxG-C-C family protein [Defluviitaleaceae bacterium]
MSKRKDYISVKQVQYDAEEVFRIGGFYCSEAIISAIRKNIAPDMPQDLVAAGSGFPIGVGRSRCMCGAISGAVVCLGYFFGRSQPSDSNDPKIDHVMRLSDELQQSFRSNREKYQNLCCHHHVEGFDLTTGQHKNQCIAFTGEMANKTARIIARELGIKIKEEGMVV